MAKLFCSKVSHNPYKEEMITEITEKVFQIDGYSVAGKQIEGILFDIHFDDSQVTSIKITSDSDREYFESTFNKDTWYNKVKDYAEEILKGDEVDVPKYIKDKYFKNGINCTFIK